MWGYLGPLRLHVLSVTGLEVSQEWSYAEQQVTDRAPVLQSTGPDLRRPELSLRWHASWCNPAAELAALRALASSRRSHLLLMGNGRPMGRFVLRQIDESQRWTDGVGRPFQIEATASLTEVVGRDVSPRLALPIPGLPVAIEVRAGAVAPGDVPPNVILRLE